MFGIYSSVTKKGDSYNDNILIGQVNLNCYNETSTKPLSKYTLREEETAQIYSKSIVIYDLNVVNCNDVYYNQSNKEEIPNYIRWGALLYNKDFEKISEIAEGIMSVEEVVRIMDKMDKLTSDSLFMSEMEYAEKLATEKGLSQGIEQGVVLTIRNMANKNMDLNIIADITGKSIEEIKEIINK